MSVGHQGTALREQDFAFDQDIRIAKVNVSQRVASLLERFREARKESNSFVNFLLGPVVFKLRFHFRELTSR